MDGTFDNITIFEMMKMFNRCDSECNSEEKKEEIEYHDEPEETKEPDDLKKYDLDINKNGVKSSR